MTLGEKQRLFAKLMGEFLVWCFANDYEVRFDEAWRTPEQAALNALKGTGVINSLHTRHLAVDLPLYLDSSLEADEDVYQKDSEAYRPLGEKWESMHSLCRWGGRFGDGNHFSLEHEGVK